CRGPRPSSQSNDCQRPQRHRKHCRNPASIHQTPRRRCRPSEGIESEARESQHGRATRRTWCNGPPWLQKTIKVYTLQLSKHRSRTGRAAHLKGDRALVLVRAKPKVQESTTIPFLLDDGGQLGDQSGTVGETEAKAVGDVFDPLGLLEQAP